MIAALLLLSFAPAQEEDPRPWEVEEGEDGCSYSESKLGDHEGGTLWLASCYVNMYSHGHFTEKYWSVWRNGEEEVYSYLLDIGNGSMDGSTWDGRDLTFTFVGSDNPYGGMSGAHRFRATYNPETHTFSRAEHDGRPDIEALQEAVAWGGLMQGLSELGYLGEDELIVMERATLQVALKDRADGDERRAADRILPLSTVEAYTDCEREQEHLQVINDLGFLLTEGGSPEQAVPYLRRVAQCESRPISYLNLADALYALGEAEAVQWYERYLEEFPRPVRYAKRRVKAPVPPARPAENDWEARYAQHLASGDLWLALGAARSANVAPSERDDWWEAAFRTYADLEPNQRKRFVGALGTVPKEQIKKVWDTFGHYAQGLSSERGTYSEWHAASAEHLPPDAVRSLHVRGSGLQLSTYAPSEMYRGCQQREWPCFSLDTQVGDYECRTAACVESDKRDGHVCGVQPGGQMARCQGNDELSALTPPEGRQLLVRSNAHTACALGVDHTLRCWGKAPHGTEFPDVQDVALHEDWMCILRRNDAQVECFGDEPTIPPYTKPDRWKPEWFDQR